MTKRPVTALEVQDLSKLKDLPRLSVYGGQYFADTPVPAAHWLVPGLIPYGVPGVMAAKGGLGKSFIALHGCISLATGKAFMDHPPQSPMGAIYLGFEDSLETFHKRVISIIDRYSRNGDWTDQDQENFNKNFASVMVNWKAVGATSYLPGLMPELEFLLDRASEKGIVPGIFIIDTLARCSEGDENTVQALRPVLNACNRLAEAGWTPLVLHHVSKGQDGARTKDKIMITDRMNPDWVRGSSSIVDNFRWLLQMTPLNEAEAEKAGLDGEKARTGGYLVFGVTKLNGGAKVPWSMLEQDEAGRWAAMPDGAEILAKVCGAKAVEALTKQVEILIDLYQATRWGGQADLAELAKKHFPDKEIPKAKNALHQVISKLRRACLLQANSHIPTSQGLQKIQISERSVDHE